MGDRPVWGLNQPWWTSRTSTAPLSPVPDPSSLILRPGGVTLEQLRRLVPEMAVFQATADNAAAIEKPATPGPTL